MRIVIAALVAAVIVFMWGFLSWAALGLWTGQVRSLPDHQRVVAVLGEAIPQSGAYFFPPMTTVSEPAGEVDQTAEMERFIEEHRRGPIGMVLIRREGAEPMSPRVLAVGFAINIVNAGLMASVVAMLAAQGAAFRARVGAAMVMALFAALSTYGLNWNWFFFPTDYTFAMIVDHLVGWGLASVTTALIVVDTKSVAKVA